MNFSLVVYLEIVVLLSYATANMLQHISRVRVFEIQHFLLYFGLPLKPFMHHEYFHHLALLSTSMWLLLKREVTMEDIELANNLIKSFCRLMKQYYGK